MAKAKPAVVPAHEHFESVTVNLPMPPSTNRLWRSGVTRAGVPYSYPAPSYAKWKDKADAAFRSHLVGEQPKTITGPFDVVMVVTIAKRFKIDIDNRIKAALDWCKRAGLIADDKYQNEVILKWGKVEDGVKLTLTPVVV